MVEIYDKARLNCSYCSYHVDTWLWSFQMHVDAKG